MSVRRGGRHRDLPLQAEVNVTSLVDVAFTLLVIFIITAPALQGGLEVDVPDVDAPPLDVRDPLWVTITDGGEVFVSESRVPLDELEATFDRLFDDGRQGIIRVDQAAPSGLLLWVNQAIADGGGEPAIATERPGREGRR